MADVTGTTRTADGTEVPFAKVVLHDAETGEVLQTETSDKNGNFVFEDVDNGDFHAVMQHPGFVAQNRQVEVRDGKTTKVRFLVEPGRDARGRKPALLAAAAFMAVATIIALLVFLG